MKFRSIARVVARRDPDLVLPPGLSHTELARFRKVLAVAVLARHMGLSAEQVADLDKDGRDAFAELAGQLPLSAASWYLVSYALDAMRKELP